MKKPEKDKAYKITLNHFGRELEYKGIIKNVGEKEFKIITKSCDKLNFNINQIISLEEIPLEDAKPKIKPLKIGNKKKSRHTNLKTPETPRGL